MAESENGPISDWNIVDGSCESMDEIVSFYTPYLKTLKDCRKSNLLFTFNKKNKRKEIRCLIPW